MLQERRCTLTGPRAGLVLSLLAALLSLPGCVLMNNQINPFQTGRKPLEEKKVEGKGLDKILIIEISNVITGNEEERPLGLDSNESTVSRVKETLRKAEKDRRVKALVLRIDSPGGGVTASDIIYSELKRFKEKRKVPVVAVLMDVAASGGYYVALSADEIVAHPTTVTGSIGVIMMNLNVEGLFHKIGVSDTTVKSGAHKDIGSPFRKPTPGDRLILQGVVDDLYTRFLDRVRESRTKLPEDRIRPLADGRIFTADQALKVGLVDRIGYVDDAIEDARKAAGLKQARVVLYHRPNEYAENIYSLQSGTQARGGVSATDLETLFGHATPRFLYLWAPGLP